MKIVLMRHGEASYSGGRSDKDRPLTTHGKDQATGAGEWLKNKALYPDFVLCSSALRTRETWEILQSSAAINAPANIMDDLYLANPHQLLKSIHSCPATTQCLLVIAHNPGLSVLASTLSNQRISLGTAHMVVFDQTNDQTRLVNHFTI